ncbi:MAG: InlB B-repeat-containing protein, partial [bacterium]
ILQNVYQEETELRAPYPKLSFEYSEEINNIWVIDKTLFINFDTDGGVPQPEQQKIKYKSTIVKPEDPKKPNVYFKGWYVKNV